MQRRRVIAGGIVLAVLLLAVGTIIFLNWGSGPAPTPEKQSALTAQPADTTVTLTWQPIDGASGYFVYRDRSDAPLNATPVTATSYEDIGLTNGKVYTYTIAPAGAGAQAGKHSAEVTVSPKSN
jgi:fibronectin type 3 domain-containing protein